MSHNDANTHDGLSLIISLLCSPAVACMAHQASGDADLHCVAPRLEDLDHCAYMGQEPVRWWCKATKAECRL